MSCLLIDGTPQGRSSPLTSRSVLFIFFLKKKDIYFNCYFNLSQFYFKEIFSFIIKKIQVQGKDDGGLDSIF